MSISNTQRLRVISVVLLTGVAFGCSDVPTAVPPEGAVDLALPWTAATPESVDMDGGALFVAGELAGRVERFRSLVVARRGRLVYERYYGGSSVGTLADVRSVTKSVVSTLVGIAIEEGHIEGLDQPITDFLRSPAHRIRSDHRAVTVGHLLSMSSGFEWAESGATQYNDWIRADDHVDYLLDRPLVASPGDSFTYNSAAVHMLGVLLEAATGRSLPAYADEVLFEPLGIHGRDWEALSETSFNGGSGLDLRPRDLARFGQLFLQRGWSARAPIVPAGWVADATTPGFEPFPGVGPINALSYGFLWWVDLDRDAYFAWGYAGQFVYVAPSLELVVVATTDWRGVGADIGSARLQEEALRIILDRVLPAIR